MGEGTPTLRQIEVLRAIVTLSVTKGYAPTVRELGAVLGISSTNGVADHLEALTRKGLVTQAPGKARTLSITAAGWRWLPAEAA